MSQLYDLKELIDKTGLPERTVRYYLTKVLEAPGGTRGHKAWYTQETLEQLLLAKEVLMREYDPKRGEVKPSLRDFKEWLNELSVENVREMVETPFRVKPKKLTTFSARINKPEMDSLMDASPAPMKVQEDQPKPSIRRSSGVEDKKQNSALDYLDRVMNPEKRHRKPHQRRPRLHPPGWKTHRFGNELEIRTCTPLTPGQERQLQLAGKMLEAMLKEGQRHD